MPLTATAVRQAKPREKDYKLSDGGGLFLLVKKNGSKYWRLKYRATGKEKLLALGVYPDITQIIPLTFLPPWRAATYGVDRNRLNA